jgi:hypothetical protein
MHRVFLFHKTHASLFSILMNHLDDMMPTFSHPSDEPFQFLMVENAKTTKVLVSM